MDIFFHVAGSGNGWFPTSRGSEARPLQAEGRLDKAGSISLAAATAKVPSTSK
jgi:hypothetical protein